MSNSTHHSSYQSTTVAQPHFLAMSDYRSGQLVYIHKDHIRAIIGLPASLGWESGQVLNPRTRVELATGGCVLVSDPAELVMAALCSASACPTITPPGRPIR
jgi:hypothetical protein